MRVSATRDLAPGLDRETLRIQAAEALRFAERIALSALIVLSPLRARIELSDRSHGPVYGDYVDFLLFWSDMAFIALLGLWFARTRLQPRVLWLGPPLVRLAVVGLVLAAWLSVPFSFDISLSAYNAIRLTAAVALALYIANEVGSLREIVPAVAAMILFQGLVSAGQVIEQGSVGLGSFGEYDLDPEVNGTSIVWSEEAGKLLRGYGLTDHPNILGGLLAGGLLVTATAISRAGRMATVLLLAAFGAGLAGLVLTFSRSGGLSFVLGALVVMGLLVYRGQWPEARRWLAAGAVAAIVAAVCLLQFSEYAGQRVNPGQQIEGSPEQRALDERTALARTTNDIFVSRPATGVGIGALPVAIEESNPRFGYNYQPAHVVLLTVAAETGIFGAFFFAVLLVAPWALLWYRRRMLTPEVIGLSGALLAVTLIGFLDYYPWSLAPGRILMWLTLGLWLGAYARMTRVDADA